MSITEMKLQAFEDLTKLNKPDEIEEVYNLLKKLNDKHKVYNLSQHFDAINNQYGDVLKKLAQ